MKDIRESVKAQTFPEFVQDFMTTVYPDKTYPTWVLEALEAVNINLS